jgi:hypothetical protein
MIRWLALLGLASAAGAALWGCAAASPRPLAAPAVTAAVPPPNPAAPPEASPVQPAPAPAHYRCDQGGEFTVRFADDSAFIDSPKRGSEVVLRDAGGVTPQQSVYSNAHLRAEFGLGAGGREAKLRYLPDPQVAHCLLE